MKLDAGIILSLCCCIETFIASAGIVRSMLKIKGSF